MSREQAIEVLRTEAEGILSLIDHLGPEFDEAVELILACQGRVILTGIGKSGIVGQKIAATLNSTGTSSLFLHPVEAMHGDLGVVGVEDLVLDFTTGRVADTLQSLTAARRLALKKRVAGLGYPGMTVSRGADPLENLAECCAFVAKYAGLILTSLVAPEEVLPILTVRQNIYTDPRKPIQVEAKLYDVGQVTPESPLLITTNFSLTYYTVAGEVEASRVAAYIGVIDTEGTSVLTAFASDKLTSEKVSAFLKSKEVKDKVAHRKVILPGYVAVMSGALQEESGWEVMVGPREASGIARYLKTVWKTK